MRFSGSGCQPCRQARKKCDETKPICQRCARNGRECYGYRQAFSVVHDENIYASGHRKRPQGPRATAESTASLMSVSLPRDLHSEAVAYFAHFHLEPTTNRPLMMGPPTKALLSNWNSSPVLELAASSTALALFSNAKMCSPAANLAFDSYQKSLRTLRTALSAPDYIDIDACLLAVCMLGRYEDAVYTPPKSDIPFLDTLHNRRHLKGAVALLEYWVNSPGGTKAPSDAIKYARRILRKAAIFGQIDLPDWLQDGALFGEQDFMRDLDRILIRLISARRQLMSFPQRQSELSVTESISTLQAMERETMSIDGALTECKALHADVSRCTQHTLAAQRVYSKQHFLLPRVYSHRSYAETAHCAHYYGYRILVNHLRICTLKLLGTYSPCQPRKPLAECQRTIDELLEDLASLTPFGLDRIKISEDPGAFGDHISIKSDEDRRLFVAELMAGPVLIASTCDSVKRSMQIGSDCNWAIRDVCLGMESCGQRQVAIGQYRVTEGELMLLSWTTWCIQCEVRGSSFGQCLAKLIRSSSRQK
ncbi:C6 zinc finger domain-protein [Lipomyces tetrasporus]|uniref:C6 zinc finger domain-protein n=1 Tax=Lipomyces tetrasporus TaxID=54092 RepID=A0AAD7VTK0_9ASCO|nr:C6 zinc finger domain-protein [Lipomyces tetrasporus]KAJ8100824.1 C6 zinc finger domain-protein [Lipomyces tetrasporus]